MKQIKENAKTKMEKSINVMLSDFAGIRAGRANPSVLNKVQVEYYGAMTPVTQMAAVSVAEARVLVIQPWDKSTLKPIEKAIQASDIGINPQNDGSVIRLTFPQLTEDRRKELVKDIKKMGEECKVAIRSIRRDAMEKFMAKNEKISLGENVSVPVHVGVIMDGNGRWAKKRGMPRKFGHREGAKTFRAITRHAKALGIQYITYYAFSTENWKRPKDEVDAIMDLFEKYLDEVRDFIEENIRVRFIGDRTRLSENLQKKMAAVEEDSKDFDSMTLVLAINYGGRDEICHAAKVLAQQVKEGKLEPEDITMDMIEKNLYTEEIPPVDLVIRPSGEQRLSNFMIWQAAYAEFYYTNILWPDFKGSDLDKAVIAYSERNRRFGGV